MLAFDEQVVDDEPSLEPQFEEGCEIATAHGAEFQVGLTPGSSFPCDGDLFDSVLSNEGGEGEFDGDVEMGGAQGTDIVDDVTAIDFEGVGHVVDGGHKEHANGVVDDALYDEFDGGVVGYLAPWDEAGAEYAVPAFFYGAVASHDIFGSVREVGHDDGYDLAGNVAESATDGASEASGHGVVDEVDFGVVLLELFDGFSGIVDAVVVYDDQLKRDRFFAECSGDPGNGLDYIAGLVIGGDHDRVEQRVFRHGGKLA